MKRLMSAVLGILMAVMCMMSMTVPAFAAENPGVSIPVTVSLSGTLPKPAEDFTIKLRADNASYPMPEGAAGDVYTMTITGADTKNLPTISYNRVGVYTYTIYQVAGRIRSVPMMIQYTPLSSRLRMPRMAAVWKLRQCCIRILRGTSCPVRSLRTCTRP